MYNVHLMSEQNLPDKWLEVPIVPHRLGILKHLIYIEPRSCRQHCTNDIIFVIFFRYE